MTVQRETSHYFLEPRRPLALWTRGTHTVAEVELVIGCVRPGEGSELNLC